MQRMVELAEEQASRTSRRPVLVRLDDNQLATTLLATKVRFPVSQAQIPMRED